MAVDWTPHRFSGGVLALDVANTVVLRLRPDKRFDRFADPAEIARFAQAASVQRAAETGGRELRVVDCADALPVVVAIRETTDALFRDAAAGGELRPVLLAPFLRAVAEGVEHEPFSPLEGEMGGSPEGVGSGSAPASWRSTFDNPLCPPGISPSRGEKRQSPLRFETALGLSALSLIPSEKHRRIRICPNCAWLFLDRSRNRSRTWCDMAVCGNREKARRHHRNKQKERADARQ